MRNIALIGGGEFEDGFEIYHKVIFELFGFEHPQIAYFPTAAAKEGEDVVNYWVNLSTEKLGIIGAKTIPILILNHDDANEDKYVQLIEAADIIYLGGGLPQVYLEILSASKAWESITSAIQLGKPIIGASAGAMILGDACLVAENPKDYPPSFWSKGFKILPNVGIAPHFDTFPKTWIQKIIKTLPEFIKLVGIDEKTALILQGEDKKKIGLGQVTNYPLSE